ncbi:hypothetical protein IMY05_C4504000100 [Salix suchowensis]|nr:hypothetical protein IMY05_C4504000100 [Salix suchowensis]
MVVPSPATSDATPSTLNVSNIDDLAPEQVMLTPAPPVTSRTPSIEMDSTSSNAFTSQPSPFAQNAGTSSAFTPPSSGPTSQASSPSPFGQAGSISAFGQPSAFGQLGRNNAPQSVFGQGSFSQKPALGGSPLLVGGFSSFANSGSSTFGQSAFGGSSVPAITVTKTPSGGSQNDDMQAEATTTEQTFLSEGCRSIKRMHLQVKQNQASTVSLALPHFPLLLQTHPQSHLQGALSNQFQALERSVGWVKQQNQKLPRGLVPSAVLAQSNPEPIKSETPTSIFGSTAKPTAPSFGQPSFGKPAFGQSSFGGASSTTSAFGTSGFSKAPTVATASPPSSGGGFASFAKSTRLHSVPSVKGDDDSPVAKPSAPQSAFSSSLFGTPSSSAFKPASGFGAFGSTTPASSPFFKTEKPVSAFGSAFSTPARCLRP